MAVSVDTLIVGGGITGLAAAHRLTTTGRTDWLLVEAESRLGGKITTNQSDGYVIEGGPDCFLASKPGGVALCRELGIDGRLMETSPAHRRTYVRRDGRLHQLPAGITGLVPTRLIPLLTSRILSLGGRVRAGIEVLVPPRRSSGDESIAEFASRRFGQEAYDWLIEPLVSGIYAGDGRALSLDATFPQLAEAERRYGSVIRMMLATRRRDGRAVQGFVTLPGGMGELVDAIARHLPSEQLRRGVSARSLRPAPGGFTVTLDHGLVVTAGSVILAVPAYAAAELVAPFEPALSEAMRSIPFVSTATVSVTFHGTAVPRRLDGYGFVSPRAAGGPIVACTWTSNKFPQRVPNGGVLIRFFLGRAGDDSIVGAPDGEIKDLIRNELASLEIAAEPSHWHVHRWPKGMPQYTLGHQRRGKEIEAAAARHPGLIVAGASYHGVGVPDCITSGCGAADRSLTALETTAS